MKNYIKNHIKTYKFKNIINVFVVIILLLIIVLAVYGYTVAVKSNVDEYAHATLDEIVSLQKDAIYTHMTSDLNLIESLAVSFEVGEVSLQEAVDVASGSLQKTYFKEILVLDLKGNGIDSNGNTITVTDTYLLERLKSQKSMIFEDEANELGQYSVKISTPVLNAHDGSIKYVIVGTYSIDSIKAFIENTFGKNGNVGVINNKGELIFSNRMTDETASGRHTYVDDLLSSIEIVSGDVNIIQNLENEKGGDIVYKYGDNLIYCKYAQLGINDWFVVIHANRETLASSANFSGIDAIIMSLVILLCLVSLLIYTDVSRNYSKKQLENIALYDKITGLPSSDKFKNQINKIIIEEGKTNAACIVFDICNFKLINDRFGSAVGDQMLRKIADVMRELERKSPEGVIYLSKLYSDTFAMLVVDIDQERQEEVALEFLERCREESRFIGEYNLNLSCGRYVSQKGDTGEIVLERALTAHAHSKDHKPNKFVNYDNAFIERLHTRSDILDNFNKALQEEEFKVFLQPQYRASNEKISGAEVLVRWIKPDGQIKYPPYIFIPVLEDAGRISELDSYLREQVCKAMRSWIDRNIQIVPISLNVSRIELLEENFVQRLMELVNKYDIDPIMLHIEITETSYVGDYEYLIQVVNELSAHGFHVEMDDFGSGYSSLNVLKDIPVDIVKLDMKFVEKGVNEARSGSILSSVVRMTQGINLMTIAEGVETREQIDYLRSIGCDFMQGYYFAKPMPLIEFEEILKGADVKETWRIGNNDENVGIDKAANFLDATAQETLLFNTFLGGAAIIEYSHETIHVLRVNDKFYEIFGKTRDTFDFFKCNLLDIFLPECRGYIIHEIQSSIATGEEVSGECATLPITEDSSIMWQRFSLRCLGKKGNRYLFYLALNDITVIKDLEVSLKEEIAKSQALIQSMPGGYIHTRVIDGFILVDSATEGITKRIGYSLEEIKELESINELVHPLDLERVKAAQMDTIINNAPFEIEQRYIGKDGNIVWFSCTGVYTRTDELNGAFEGFFYDITALQEAKEKVEAFINNTSDGFGQFTIKDGEITTDFVSEGFCNISGYTYDDFMQNHINSFAHPDDLEMIEKAEQDTILNGVPFKIEYRFRHKEGYYLWLRAIGRYVSDGPASGVFYGSFFDINHYKEVMSKLEETQKELKEMKKKLDDGMKTENSDEN